MKVFTGIRERLVILLPFAYYFVGPLAFVSYFFSIRLTNLKMKKSFVVIVLFLLYLIIYHLNSSGFESILQIRYYWGWVLFFMFFSTYRAYETYISVFKKVLIFLCIYTLFEAVLVNSFIDASTLPNYPKDRLEASSHFSDIYQRPYSFGGNPAVTSTLLVVISSMIQLRLWDKILLTLTVLSVGSATGMILLVLSAILKLKNSNAFIILTVFLGTVYAAYYYFVPSEYFGKEKMTIGYFIVIINDKWTNLLLFEDQSKILHMIFGIISDGKAYGGDFPFFTMMINFGLFGLLILGLFICYAISRSIFLPLFLLIVGSLHYGAIFSLPGQMLFGLLLARGLGPKKICGVNDQARDSSIKLSKQA